MITFKFIATDGKTRTIRSERNYDALIEELEEKMNKKPWYEKDFETIEVRDKENKINFNLHEYNDDYPDVDTIINALQGFKLLELTFGDFIALQQHAGTFVTDYDISIYDSVDALLKDELDYLPIDLEGRLRTDDYAFDYKKVFNIEYLKELVINADNVFLTENRQIIIIARH